MRSRTEHINLKWRDVELKETSTGAKLLELSERATKTGTGVTGDTRAFAPKCSKIKVQNIFDEKFCIQYNYIHDKVMESILKFKINIK